MSFWTRLNKILNLKKFAKTKTKQFEISKEPTSNPHPKNFQTKYKMFESRLKVLLKWKNCTTFDFNLHCFHGHVRIMYFLIFEIIITKLIMYHCFNNNCDNIWWHLINTMGLAYIILQHKMWHIHHLSHIDD